MLHQAGGVLPPRRCLWDCFSALRLSSERLNMGADDTVGVHGPQKDHDKKGVTDRKQDGLLEFGVIEFAVQSAVATWVIFSS